MGLDVAGIIIILVFFIRGYMKGLILAAFSVIAILLGILCALKLSQSFASWLLQHDYVSTPWAQIISYIVLFIGVVLLVRLIGKMVQKTVEGMLLGTVNKLLGGLLYAFLGAVVWSSLLWIGGRAHIIPEKSIKESVTYASLSALAPWFFEVAGALLPFVKDTFAKLANLFDTLNAQPADVGAH